MILYMGRAKELHIEGLQRRDDEKLAKLLGITYEELMQTERRIEPDESEEGMLYGYVVSFNSESPKHILHKIKDIDVNNQVWLSPHEFGNENNDFEEQYEAIITNKFTYKSCQSAVKSITQLNDIELENQVLQQILRRQLYVASISALETFLSETFINLTNDNQDYFKNFIKTYPKFKESRFRLNEIYMEYDKLQETAKKEMLEIIYHNLAKGKNLYTSTFKIRFPDITELSKAVNIRHDLVHRNGKTKDGADVVIQKETITELLAKVSDFVESISMSLKQRN